MPIIRIIFVMALLCSFQAKAQNVQLSFGGPACSAFLAQFNAASEEVYLFTAGHCLPSLYNAEDSEKVILNTDLSTVVGHMVSPFPATVGRPVTGVVVLWPKQVVFATFQKVDLAIISVNHTASELKEQGLIPFLIDLNPLTLHTPVTLVESEQAKTASCQIESEPHVLSFKNWSWTHSARLSKECQLERGWSGAQVLTASNQVIGVLSGGNDTGQCDDYCETDTNGQQSAFLKQSYFTKLDFLKSCVDESGILNAEKCQP